LLSADIEPRITDAFRAHGQGHVLRHLDALAPRERAAFLEQLADVDLALMAKLVASGGDAKTDLSRLAPAPYVALGSPSADARAHGEALLRAGKVAAFTVAGGQGTRLGWRGPKGTYPATCVTGKPLFRVFAEQIAAAEKRFGCAVPWYIMTSPLNDADTRAFFRDNNWFGRNPADTFLFPQGTMPSITFDGKLMLETRGSLDINHYRAANQACGSRRKVGASCRAAFSPQATPLCDVVQLNSARFNQTARTQSRGKPRSLFRKKGSTVGPSPNMYFGSRIIPGFP